MAACVRADRTKGIVIEAVEKTPYVIVGGGVSGCSLSAFLHEPSIVLERSVSPGGHCASTIREGWTYDRGPHILFSRDQEVLHYLVGLLGENVHTCERNNKIAIAGVRAGYPLENYLSELPPEERFACARDLLLGEDAFQGQPRNLEEWFLQHFGAALVDLYFRPYNEKVWKTPLQDLSMSWADRIPLPPKEDVLAGAVGLTRPGYVHQLYYQYPRVGGYQALAEAVAEQAQDVRCGHEVQSISVGTRVRVATQHGLFEAPRVVWTAPVHELPHVFEGDLPEQLLDDIARLRVNPTVVVTLGFRGEDKELLTALYVADPEVLANRISFPATFSPANAPAGHFSIQSEITLPPEEWPPSGDRDMWIQRVLDDLVGLRLVTPDQLVFADVEIFRYAYVVYDAEYEIRLARVKEYFAELGIILHGRFGAFEYLNADGCVIRSRELASSLNGRPVELPRATPGGAN